MYSSYEYIPIDGIPIPEAITVISFPLYSPVKASIFLTEFTCFTLVKNVSAINLALNGSPGINTFFAISPGLA